MSGKTPPTSPTSPTSSKKSGQILVTKRVDKARLTYFSFKIKSFSFEIATSSFTGIPMREKDILPTFYSKVLFSKLPDILQTSYGQKYLILTLNPIVELYEDCKNILNATLYRSQFTKSKEEEAKDMEVSKEMLSSTARRKLEQFEKIMESSTIKIRKIEDECFFYKMKFEELEERLKNLISTHHN